MRLILMLFAFIFVISSCEKESVKNSMTTQLDEVVDNTINEENTTRIRSRINSFKERIEHTRQGGEVEFRDGDLSVEELKWNISATVNTVYGRISTPFNQIDVDISESSIQVPINGNIVDNEAVLNAYDETVSSLSVHYSSVHSASKQTMYVSLDIVESSLTSITLNIRSVIGIDLSSDAAYYTCEESFEPEDNWLCCDNNGRCCDSPPCPDYGMDASIVLEEKLNHLILNQIELPDGYMGIVDDESIFIDTYFFEPSYIDYLNPEDGNPGDNYRDYRIWRFETDGLQPSNCLPEEELEWYLCSILEMGEEIAAYHSKELLGFSINSERIEDLQYLYGGVTLGNFYSCHDACPDACPPPNSDNCDCC